MNWKKKYNPAIPKRYHFLIAGTMWFLVGATLSTVGIFWIFPVKHTFVVFMIPLALIIGFIKGKLVLFKAANKTSQRIYAQPEKASVCSVFSRETWIVIFLMILIGQILRRFIVPIDYRDCLGLLYVLIGLALSTASYVYWKNFFLYSTISIKETKGLN